MNLQRSLLAATVVLGFAAGHAHAASFDLGRIVGGLKDIGTALTPIEEKEEIAIGRELAGRTLGAARLVNDPELQAYVNRVGRWIAAQSERPDLPWRFGVIEDAAINAYAMPGGVVLITRGLYQMLGNESQLAGALGHEIAHIMNRHHISAWQKSSGLQGGAALAQEAAAQRTRGGLPGVVADKLLGTGAEVLARGLDKGTEYEADRLGVILAARAGYSPYGLVEVLHQLQAQSPKANEVSVFSTHPAAGDRLTELGRLMEPKLAQLPAGVEPPIQAVSATAGPARAAAPPPAGVRALQQPDSQQQPPAGSSTLSPSRGSGSGVGIDPGSVLRGIFGR